MDVTNQESIHQAVVAINEKYGRLDVLINNAGVYLDKNEKLLTMDPCILAKQWQPISSDLSMSSVPLFQSWKNKAMGELLMFPQNMGQ
jgi:NAD(P)-dependent dehydrogenase (short-subunit alcohol dehydrogenase family)